MFNDQLENPENLFYSSPSPCRQKRSLSIGGDFFSDNLFSPLDNTTRQVETRRPDVV